MIRLFVVHNVRLVCDQVASTLHRENDMKTVGYDTNLEDPKSQLQAQDCDLVLIDVTEVQASTLDFIEHVTQNHGAQVLVIGVHEQEDGGRQSLQAGACQCIDREDSLSGLLATIRSAHTDPTGSWAQTRDLVFI